MLFTYALLVDEGRQLDGADRLKEALSEPAFAELHPQDAARLGLSDGRPARLRTSAGEAVVPIRVSEGIAAGSVFVPWNQPGLAVNTLLSGRTTTAVTLEPAGEVSAAVAGGEDASP